MTLAGNMQGWNFERQDLSGARFDRGSRLTGTMWAGAKLEGTLFFVSTLPGTDFRHSQVSKVRFSASNVDGSDFSETDLSQAEFSQTSAVGANFNRGKLTGARFVRADLTNASFVDADLRGADFVFISSFAGTNFSGADVRDAEFAYATDYGFAVDQLRATRSFQQRDLSGVDFEGNTFAGIDLSNFRLAGGDFNRANLTEANFSGADATGVSFMYATLTGLDLSNAVVRRANFNNGVSKGFTREMLESTASFKLRQLDGIDLSSNNLSNWDFRNQDLREAKLESNLTGVAFDHSDLRGARLPSNRSGVDLQQAILPDGTLAVLQVADGETLAIRPAPTLVRLPPLNPRDPVNQTPIPQGVKVTGLEAELGGTLEMLFGAGDWKSTIVFKPQAEVALDGVLKLSFDGFAPPAGAVGKSFDLFDWPTTGPIGQFDVITNPNHVWDFANLYTTGTVRLVAVVPEPSSSTILSGLCIGATLFWPRRRFRGA